MIRFQLRLRPQGSTTKDFFLTWPILPRIGDEIYYDLGEKGSSWWVEEVVHFMSGEDEGTILVVASWRRVRLGERE